ncbi:MAG TPA: cellulase family glycosylhydrolase [Paludibacteraceae bacterium]|nr:cellulase family glycosylhydrolase [Paludibacteraceae bacterium]HOU69483.1 cellulase family glycosylhydrolase [Paludibacteraceae bacterium]HPH63756.1 cellulase family glycosylhydrolase [Paludibacteraceae bacterium]HQF51098.1 cellulase family glycosylhydrolase [Paludibacteraceae bacterium]HQJ90231.1 cellulase family glycosylhydrolase [Paludibacteraceae bacterium]
MTKKDFDSIAAMGFDFVRIPIDEVHFYDENMNRDNEAFQLLKNAINWALEDSLNVIVDLHIVRSHHFNNENKHANTLFQDSVVQAKFIAVWMDLQKSLKDYLVDRVAYEILNEAVAPHHEDWNKLLAKACKALRVAEPNRYLVIGSNGMQTVHTFDSLRVPENDPRLILSFHYYEPVLVTHYRAPWTPLKDYDGPISYPGFPIADTSIYKKNPDLAFYLRYVNQKPWNKEQMVKDFEPAIKKAKELNLQLFCGEFGVYPKYIDKEVRFKWYNDMVSAFRENNIANCHWCYKGDFPVVSEDGSANELPAILTRK